MKPKSKKSRVALVSMGEFKSKKSIYWSPSPYDKRRRFIPSSVMCLFNQEYFTQDEAILNTFAL